MSSEIVDRDCPGPCGDYDDGAINYGRLANEETRCAPNRFIFIMMPRWREHYTWMEIAKLDEQFEARCLEYKGE